MLQVNLGVHHFCEFKNRPQHFAICFLLVCSYVPMCVSEDSFEGITLFVKSEKEGTLKDVCKGREREKEKREV